MNHPGPGLKFHRLHLHPWIVSWWVWPGNAARVSIVSVCNSTNLVRWVNWATHLITTTLQASIGSIFLVPSPVSTKLGRNFRTSGSSRLGLYKDMCQLKSGKIAWRKEIQHGKERTDYTIVPACRKSWTFQTRNWRLVFALGPCRPAIQPRSLGTPSAREVHPRKS